MIYLWYINDMWMMIMINILLCCTVLWSNAPLVQLWELIFSLRLSPMDPSGIFVTGIQGSWRLTKVYPWMTVEPIVSVICDFVKKKNTYSNCEDCSQTIGNNTKHNLRRYTSITDTCTFVIVIAIFWVVGVAGLIDRKSGIFFRLVGGTWWSSNVPVNVKWDEINK